MQKAGYKINRRELHLQPPLSRNKEPAFDRARAGQDPGRNEGQHGKRTKIRLSELFQSEMIHYSPRCEKCGKRFKGKKYLREHKQKVHSY